ncbi:hypothetical protein U1872_16110 [Sphingomonas sp. RB3P16]|uniref:hypothetical protein n=1 Tax=Parasphingomonas frigoris TaxID=3096163 RepID=UPI002FCC6715
MTALLAAQVAHAQSFGGRYDPPSYRDGKAHYEKGEESFGQFAVVRYVEDRRETPIPDVASVTMESTLNWHDSRNRIGFAIKDDGSYVTFQAQGKSADGKTICIMGSTIVDYDRNPSTIKNWQNLQPLIREQIKGCTAIDYADFDRAMMEMHTSSFDYVAAANYWKSVSAGLFGPSGRRCLAERMIKPHVLPPQFECTRFSLP